MTEQQSAFLHLLGEYLFGLPKADISEENAQAALRMAVPQNILGICAAALKGHGEYRIPDFYRKPVVAQTVMQVRKTARFLAFYKKLVSCHVSPVCVKGITVRELYPEPDLRPSSDEDLIVEKAQLRQLSDIAVQDGFRIVAESENQITVYDEISGLLVEAQTCFFLPDERISQRMNGFFDSARSRLIRSEHQGVSVLELGHTDHLLYLLCHVLKHYIRSGFGIRQICDILLFSRTYRETIDFDYVFERLGEISADGFAADIFQIGKERFGLEEVFPQAARGRETDFERLVEDVFAAGVFGKSSKARTHSAAITLAAVKDSDGVTKSAAKRAFLSVDELQKHFPGLEKRRYLYLYYSFKRLAAYFCKPKSVSMTKESVKIASDRVGQFNRYGLLGEREKREYDEAVVSVLRERIKSGKTADLTVTGSSMTPFLVSRRDSVELAAIMAEPEKGDVVFYRRDNGAFVLHRVVKKDKNGFYFAGDSQTFVEGPVRGDQLIAVCVSFCRKGRKITGHEARWKIYDFLWRLLLRFRPVILTAWKK